MEDEPEKRRVSLRDIAKHLGVSHAAVSLALRGSTQVSMRLRESVKKTADELGYWPDPMLSTLSSYRLEKSNKPVHSVIAWINAWPEPETLRSFKEFDSYWIGATRAANKLGYRLEEFRMTPDVSPNRLHRILYSRGIRGILLPPQSSQPDWDDFAWSEYSVVRFGRSMQNPRCHVVTSDQVENTITAFDEIHKRGYRRIGFITDETNMRQTGHLFESGYLTAQRFRAVSERLRVFGMDQPQLKDRKKALAAWLKAHKPDAIITNMAEVAPLLKSMGVRIPEDVALAGTTILDSNIDAGIDQHPEEIGRVALIMLNSLINQGSRGIPKIFRQVLVEGSWVDGTALPDKRDAP